MEFLNRRKNVLVLIHLFIYIGIHCFFRYKDSLFFVNDKKSSLESPVLLERSGFFRKFILADTLNVAQRCMTKFLIKHFIYLFCICGSNFAGILHSLGPIYIIDCIRRCNELADKRDSKEKSYWLYANVVQLHN